MFRLISGPATVCLAGWVSLAGLSGCGSSEPQGGPRVKTSAVTGIVHVDGQPASYLRVVANPAGDNGAVPITPAALTTPDGKFELSTYESGDGLPAGEYKLTFQWGEISLLNGQYSGDKFKGKYAKPEASTVTVKVADGDPPVDLGVIELTSK